MKAAKTAWRVTGWDAQEKKEFNLGMFLADFREEAIKQAGKDPRAKHLVLDACRIGS